VALTVADPARGRSVEMVHKQVDRDAVFPCPCCGYLVFDEPPGSYSICPICFWEDGDVQLRWPDRAGGANRPSLIDSQREYRQLGVMESRFPGYVRPPTDSETVEAGWRTIDPAVDRFEKRGVHEVGWPDDLTVLYWWRPSFWQR